MSKRKKKAQPENETTTPPEAAQPGHGSDPAAADGEGGESAPEAAELTRQLSDMEAKWLRARADLDNVRRRARLDLEEARSYSINGLLQALLPVIDALQHALSSATSDESGSLDDPILEGLRLTEQQFLAVLEGHGVQPVPAEPGSPCDPSIHRVLIEQVSDEFAPGQIVSEITRGYKLKDRLLREAQVAVAARPTPATNDATAERPEGDLPDADV